MSADNTQEINSIIERLRTINIQQQGLAKEEQELLEKLNHRINGRKASGSFASSEPGGRRIKEEDTLPFKVGDRVFIKNKLGSLAPLFGRSVTLKDRAAVVTNSQVDRVDLRTFQSKTSWRAPHNLRFLSAAEAKLLEE